MKSCLIKATLFFCLIGYTFPAAAQPDSTLYTYATQFPHEKIFIHFDKSTYLPSDTVWFKAYIVAGNQPSAISKNLYLVATDETGKPIFQFVGPIQQAGAYGNFSIPEKYKGNKIFLKSYTSWMLNFDSSFWYKNALDIVQNETSTAPQKTTTELQFFPEGGYWIENIVNKMAFKATYSNGLPATVNGLIFNQQNKLIQSFKTLHNGMGSIDIIAKPSETYYAKWTDLDGTIHQEKLPVAIIEGANFSAKLNNKGGIKIDLARTKNSANRFRYLRLMATMCQYLVYRSNINLTDTDQLALTIPTADFPSGVMQITLMDENWQAIAERVVFINNGDYEAITDMRVFKPTYASKAKNYLEVHIGDTTLANLSVAVTDAALTQTPTQNIVSTFLLSSELKGYIHNPAFYFSNQADSTQKFLDLVMLTHGWRKIKWEDVMAKKLPTIKYPADTAYFSLLGKVFGLNSAQIREANALNLILKFSDSTKDIITLPLKTNGDFAAFNFPFYDTLKAFYQLNTNKPFKSLATIQLQTSLQRLPNYVYLNSLHYPTAADSTNLKNYIALREAARQREIAKRLRVLEDNEVVVTAVKKSPEKELDIKYATGMFQMAEGRNFDVESDPTALGSMNILSYLQGKVAGLSLGNVSSGSQESSITWRGSPTLLYLNEMQVNADEIKSLNMNDIAYVKVASPPFHGASSGGAGGAILIYTKKGGAASNNNTPPLPFVQLLGYTGVKQFYAPNYGELSQERLQKDMRITLYWNPNLIIDAKKRTFIVPFYNSDNAKQFRIILQGLDADGKLIYAEKLSNIATP